MSTHACRLAREFHDDDDAAKRYRMPLTTSVTLIQSVRSVEDAVVMLGTGDIFNLAKCLVQTEAAG